MGIRWEQGGVEVGEGGRMRCQCMYICTYYNTYRPAGRFTSIVFFELLSPSSSEDSSPHTTTNHIEPWFNSRYEQTSPTPDHSFFLCTYRRPFNTGMGFLGEQIEKVYCTQRGADTEKHRGSGRSYQLNFIGSTCLVASHHLNQSMNLS